jgi:hypothetical protein
MSLKGSAYDPKKSVLRAAPYWSRRHKIADKILGCKHLVWWSVIFDGDFSQPARLYQIWKKHSS